MQQNKKKGKTTQDVTHRAHAAVAGGQCSRGIQASIMSQNPKMWQLGKTNLLSLGYHRLMCWYFIRVFQTAQINSMWHNLPRGVVQLTPEVG